MSAPIALEAAAVSKSFVGGVIALVGVDLAVDPGSTVILIGESGSGKTTLLRMFNLLEVPDRGEVRIGGRPARELDVVHVRRHTGYVQQEGGLLPHWTVGRNVALVPELLGWSRPDRERRASELLTLVGLDPGRYADRVPRELSGGQRQRVAFARALAADPGVVLLDEPFGALDALTRRDLQDEFLKLKGALGKTMLVVTHDIAEALRLGDRIAVLRHGSLLQTGAPADIRDDPVDDYVHELVLRGTGAGA